MNDPQHAERTPDAPETPAQDPALQPADVERDEATQAPEEGD